ncbi:MFS transporter [Mycobacterium ahvazicum]|uniref:MFS transporter n=1 Tax=Mycobacterium TaxID=1763 RepID=UPI001FAEA44E|nr:MFS transporter [Mycobacterium ahvazicum]
MNFRIDARQVAPKNRVLVVAIVASMVTFLDGNIINLALPATAHELGGGLTLQQWIVDGYLLALAVAILPGGSLSDLFGRLPMLRVGLVTFALGTALAVVAAWPAMLIVARLVQGLGGALLVPGSLALINSTFDRTERPAAIGAWTAWTSTIFALGPVLGGLAVDYLGWRWIYFLLMVPAIVAFALTYWLRPTPRPVERARVDFAGAALTAIGLGAIVYALIESNRGGWSNPLVATLLAVGVAALLAFVAWERRAPQPMVPLKLFAMRNFAGANLATAFIYGGLTLGSIAMALYLQEVAGYSALLAGLITLPTPVASMLFARRVGNAAARVGPRIFLTGGPVLAAIGLLTICPSGHHFDFLTNLLPGRLMLAAGLVLTITPLSSVILVSVEPVHSGIAAAIQNAVGRTSALTAVACLGVITAGPLNNAGFTRLLEVSALLYLAGAVVAAMAVANPAVPAEPITEKLPLGDTAGETPTPVWPTAPEPQRPPRLRVGHAMKRTLGPMPLRAHLRHVTRYAEPSDELS